MNISLPLLMGLGAGGDGNDLLAMMFMANSLSGENVSDNKRLESLMLAPVAKKFVKKLAAKIQRLSPAGRAELIASLIAHVMAQRTDGEMSNILDMAAMSGLMAIMNSSGVPMNTGNSDQVVDVEPSSMSSRSGMVGGEVTGILYQPKDEAKKIALPAKKTEAQPKSSGSKRGYL